MQQSFVVAGGAHAQRLAIYRLTRCLFLSFPTPPPTRFFKRRGDHQRRMALALALAPRLPLSCKNSPNLCLSTSRATKHNPQLAYSWTSYNQFFPGNSINKTLGQSASFSRSLVCSAANKLGSEVSTAPTQALHSVVAEEYGRWSWG